MLLPLARDQQNFARQLIAGLLYFIFFATAKAVADAAPLGPFSG
jgi:hypothetical protein